MTVTSDTIRLTLDAIIIAAILGGSSLAAWRRRRRSPSIANVSVLLSYYTQDAQLVTAGSGEIDGYPYTAIITADMSMLLFRVQLDFSSRLHLLGIPKTPGVTQLDPAHSGSLMERVELEGDYNNFFSLYCEHGQQGQARYILDPQAMAFTIDFCRSQNWEIVDHELYFVQTTASHAADPTPMFDDIGDFIKNIKPAIGLPLSEQQLRDSTPYGVERRKSLKCPLCQAVMPNQDGLFLCPDGHGLLLNAVKLHRLHSGQIEPPSIANAQPPADRGDLVCPSCQHQMTKVPYNGNDFVIDTCTKCHYRWLDAPEISRIARH